MVVGMFACKKEEQPILSIGLIADPQYQDKNTWGKRDYRASIKSYPWLSIPSILRR